MIWDKLTISVFSISPIFEELAIPNLIAISFRFFVFKSPILFMLISYIKESVKKRIFFMDGIVRTVVHSKVTLFFIFSLSMLKMSQNLKKAGAELC